jgi:nicotinamidase-related amidase
VTGVGGNRAVLVVIDVQNGFVKGDSVAVVPRIVNLVARWQAAGGDTVFTRYINYPDSPYVRLVRWSELMNSPQIDIAPELLPYAENATAVIDKGVYSLFADAAGAHLVAEHGWTEMYVCGLTTESCVLATALGAFENGLTPWLVVDASATHAGREAQDAGLLVARRFIGASQIIRVADIPVGLLAESEPTSAR